MVEQRDETQHDQKPHHPLLEMGLFLVVVASPLAWTPLTSAAFVDLKLVTVLVGALLMAIGTRRVDATVCLAAGLWFGAVTVASALGVDPGWSLLGEERQSAGLVMYLACAVLICVGGSIPASLRARIPLWLVVTGMLVAGLQILQTFVDIGASNWTLGRSGSTLGHPVAVGAFMAVAVTCCASVLRPRLYVPLLVVLASALSLTANRGGWIGLVLGVAVSFRMSRTGLGRVAATAAAVAVTFASWAIVDATTDGLRPLSAAARADQVDESLSERVRVWKVFSRGWLDKPLSGWGPGTGQGAFLSSAGVRDMRVLGRGWADAHNLFVQSATTTGVLGTVALIALWAVVAAKAWRKPGEAWIFGAVAALGVYHLLQPLSVILTPMLFLFGGMLLKEAAQEWKALRHGVVALLAVGVVLSCMRFGASWAERSGRIYGSQTALRRASSLDPWRVRAPHELALSLAIDSRAGRSGAASEAFRISSSTVREHRWEPTVRSLAADVSLVARDFEQARVWLVEQVGRFPNDYATLSSASQLFLSEGDLGLAKQFASRALEIRPFDRRARAVLRQVEKRQIDAMKGASALAAMEEGPPRGGPS